MPTLREAAIKYKAQRSVFDLTSIPTDIDFKEGTFKNAQGQDVTYSYVDIDGYKYTIKAKIMSHIKMVLEARPSTKNIKISQNEKGDVMVIPLD